MHTCQPLIKGNLKTHEKNVEIVQKVVRFYFSIGGSDFLNDGIVRFGRSESAQSKRMLRINYEKL